LNCQKSAEAILDWWIYPPVEGLNVKRFWKFEGLPQKQTTSQEGCSQKRRLEAGNNGKALSILSASDNRRNGENAYSIILQNDMHK
jgi:hypothetical protein